MLKLKASEQGVEIWYVDIEKVKKTEQTYSDEAPF